MMLLLLLCSIVPLEIPLVDHVDLIEVNHYYDDQGKLVLNQAIFREWNPHENRHDCIGWRLLKSPSAFPVNGEMVFMDGGEMRKVVGEVVIETWTQHDPELCERAIFPKELRPDLTKRVTSLEKLLPYIK